MSVLDNLLKKQGIRLDIGCGANKNPGFIGIDLLPLKEVDIVWDIEVTPWQVDNKDFPAESVSLASASHVLEHIEPHGGVFIDVMNEIWRILKPNGQFLFVVPYAGSPGFYQDPTHCNPINETTMHYFDPDPEHENIGMSLYGFYRPKPWKIVKQYFNPQGNLEVALRKRQMDRSYPRRLSASNYRYYKGETIMAKLNGVNDSGNNRYKQRLLVATPTKGTVRMEWVTARYNQTIPTNWSKTDMIQFMNPYIPLRYTVHDAQNLAVKAAIDGEFEWLMLIEDDTMPPIDNFVRFTEYMDKSDIPVVSGLYFTRSIPPEPMLYRGRGNHYFRDWKLEDRVWVDGLPTGLLLIHTSLLKVMYDDSPEYDIVHTNGMPEGFLIHHLKLGLTNKLVFKKQMMSTSDLNWCTRVIKGNYLKKAGFPEIAKKKYPFLIDTNIYAFHINPDGQKFPIDFPPEFLPDEKRGRKK